MSTCPRCQQLLPDPPPRFCPNCGYDTLEAAEPLGTGGAPGGGTYSPPPLPPGPPPGGAGAGGGPPWERRQQIGFAGAFVETTQRVLAAPTDFFRSMPIAGGIGSPLLYGVIAGFIGLVASGLYRFVLSSTIGAGWATGGGGSPFEQYLPMLSSGMGLFLQILFGPVVVAVVIFVVSAVVHLCLLLVGGATSGFEGTLRVAAYSQAAMVIRIVPICGDLVATIYYVILMIIGVSAAHRISGLKAAAAVLLPFVLFCCCCAAGIVMMAGGIASLVQQAQ
jgi:hypothetical protein